MVCQYPEVQGLEGHLYTIQREIEQFRPQRLVLDSVSALERVGNVRNFRQFVIGLTSFVKQKQICSLFTSSSPRLSGGDSITDAHISTITDAILLLRCVERNGELSRGVIIIKIQQVDAILSADLDDIFVFDLGEAKKTRGRMTI
jgi:circadian clock protein KaiC